MEEELKSYNNLPCNCYKIAQKTHELNQSLTIIHSYVKGCIERLKRDNVDLRQFMSVLETVNVQIQQLSQEIHCLV